MSKLFKPLMGEEHEHHSGEEHESGEMAPDPHVWHNAENGTAWQR